MDADGATAAVGHVTHGGSGRIRVCIVDDIEDIRRNLTTLVSFEPDFEIVGTASDGQIAIEVVRREQPDVVLMDVYMPTMDGFTAASAITAAVPGTKIILMSVNGSADFRRQAIAAGAAGFLPKLPPFTWDEAASLIRRLGRPGQRDRSEEKDALRLAAARIKREREAVEVSLRDFALMERNRANRLN